MTWRYDSWIYYYDLNKLTVLDYFKHSPFYDATCNNEVVLQQGGSTERIYEMEGLYYEPDLKTSSQDPTYFMIRKLHRERRPGGGGRGGAGRFRDRLLALYYVLGQGPGRGTVFALPDLHSVLRYNLSTSLHYANSAFQVLRERVKYNRGKHYTWDHSDRPENKNQELVQAASSSSSSTKQAQQQQQQQQQQNQQADSDTKHPMSTETETVTATETTTVKTATENNNQINDSGNNDDTNNEKKKKKDKKKLLDPNVAKLVNEVLAVTLYDSEDLERLRKQREQGIGGLGPGAM